MSQERRDFPRIEEELSAEILDANDGVFPALILDISLTGAQLLCDRPTAEHMVPEGVEVPGDDPIELGIRLRVSLGDGSRAKIRGFGHLMAIREVGDDEFRLGIKFTRFAGDSYTALEAYIDETLPD